MCIAFTLTQAALTHASNVHTSSSMQSPLSSQSHSRLTSSQTRCGGHGTLPDWHVSLTQVSAPLQYVPSSQSVSSQHSATHVSELSQQTGVPPEHGAVPDEHVPLWQVSSPLQKVPSGQGVPLGAWFDRHDPDPLHVFGSVHVVLVWLPHA